MIVREWAQKSKEQHQRLDCTAFVALIILSLMAAAVVALIVEDEEDLGRVEEEMVLLMKEASQSQRPWVVALKLQGRMRALQQQEWQVHTFS